MPSRLPRALAPALVLALAACRSRPAVVETGLVRLSLPYEVATLDPHARNALSNFVLAAHLYDRLADTDADLKLRPALAESWSTPDDRTWVFKLRPNVRFHDGRALRADDVVWSIRRLMDNRALELSAYVSRVASVRALDPATVEVRTTEPVGILLNRLRFVFVVPEGQDGPELSARANGTGPFRLVEWEPGRRLRLARNEAYWGERPSLGELELLLGRGPEEAAADLLSGRARLAEVSSRRAEARLAAAGFTVVRQPSVAVKYLGFGFTPETIPGPAGPVPNPFRRHEVREAVHLALDRVALVSRRPAAAMPATQPVPPTIFGYNPGIAPAPYDPERARALLQQAGFPRGFQATLTTRRIFADVGEQVREQLARVGIDLTLEVLDDTAFLDRAPRQEFALYLSRLGSVTGDGTNVLENGLHSVDRQRGMGVANFGGYTNVAIDRAIEQSALLSAPAQRRRALESIMARLMDELPWAPLFVDEDVFGIAPGLEWRPRRDGFVLGAEVSARR